MVLERGEAKCGRTAIALPVWRGVWRGDLVEKPAVGGADPQPMIVSVGSPKSSSMWGLADTALPCPPGPRVQW